MTDYNWVYPTAAAVAGVVFSFFNRKKLDKVGDDVNGKMDRFNAIAVANAFKEGHAAGIKYEQERMEADRQLRRGER